MDTESTYLEQIIDLKVKSNIQWVDVQTNELNDIREMKSKYCILTYPNTNKPYVIEIYTND